MNSELLRFTDILRETFHVELPPSLPDRIDRFHVELLEWNPVASLLSESTSAGDLSRHTLDSLALVPYLTRHTAHGHTHIDVGSGGGFPAIPVALAIPELPVVCIERNARKAAFIERTARILQLQNIAVDATAFEPSRVPDAATLTARAIERPDAFVALLTKHWPTGLEFWSQLRDTPRLFGPGYLCEEIRDSLAEFRRGRLYRVTRGDVPRGT